MKFSFYHSTEIQIKSEKLQASWLFLFLYFLNSSSTKNFRRPGSCVKKKVCEEVMSEKMDFDSQQQAETELLSSEVSKRRNSECKIKSESLEVQRKKQKRKQAIGYILLAVSEAIGTSMLLYIGCAGTIPNLSSAPTGIEISVVFGLAIFIIVEIFFHISGGHINPAITVAALISKVVSLPVGAVYIIAQLFGAILGYGLLLVSVPKEALYRSGQSMNTTHGLCTTLPHPKVALWQAFIVEFVATAVLVFLCCSIWDKKNQSRLNFAPLKIGVSIFVLATVMGSISGCSLNPARSIAPAFYTGVWEHQWIYWLGPLSAAVATSYFYKFVFLDFENPNQSDSST